MPSLVAPSKDEALENVQTKALGTQKFRLSNIYPEPDPYRNHKVEAKGFLIRGPNEDRVNVTSMQSLYSHCDAPR